LKRAGNAEAAKPQTEVRLKPDPMCADFDEAIPASAERARMQLVFERD
jgi:hypothetical protein